MSSIVQIRKVAKSYLLYLPKCKHKGLYPLTSATQPTQTPGSSDEALPLRTPGSRLWLPIGRHFVFDLSPLARPIINMQTTITAK